MKKLMILFLALSLVCTMMLTGCKEEKTVSQQQALKIALSQKTATLEAYGKLVLTASVTDYKGQSVEDAPISWTSSNPGVARVSDGVVIGAAEGQAEITAQLESGEAASCLVTVENKGVIPQLVLSGITDSKLTIAKGQSFRLDGMVTFAGVDCTEEDTVFTYAVADSSIATVSADGVIQAVAAGTTQLTVTATWRGMGGKTMEGGPDAYGLQLIITLNVVQA